MPIFSLILVLVIIGAIMYAINRWVPMQPGILKVLNIAVIVLVVIWVATVIFGINLNSANIRVGR